MAFIAIVRIVERRITARGKKELLGHSNWLLLFGGGRYEILCFFLPSFGAECVRV